MATRSAKRYRLAGLLPMLVLSMHLSLGYTANAFADSHQRTRAEAIEIAKSRSGDGRLLGVKKKTDKNGDSVFAVKIISNGRVKVYAIREFTN